MVKYTNRFHVVTFYKSQEAQKSSAGIISSTPLDSRASHSAEIYPRGVFWLCLMLKTPNVLKGLLKL